MHPKGRSKRSPVRCKRCPGEIPVMWLLCAAKVPGHIAHVLKLTVTIGCCIMLHYDPGPKICKNYWRPLMMWLLVPSLQKSSESRVLYFSRNLYYKRSKWRSMIHPWSHGPVEVRPKDPKVDPQIPIPSQSSSLSGCSSVAYKLVLTPSNSRINININIYI